MNNSEDKFIQQVCQYLDRSLLELDDSTVTRLDGARAEALLRNVTGDSAVEEELLMDSVLTNLEDQEPPAHIASRLDAIRAQALSRQFATEKQPHRNLWERLQELFGGGFSLSASMLATACVLVTVVSLFYVGSSPDRNLNLDEELTLIASAQDLELYENLDFYLWLEENGFAN